MKRRQALVQRLQEDEDEPFFVLSLKAGDAGLNLTTAAQVIHFDRRWNQAVENQADLWIHFSRYARARTTRAQPLASTP